MTAFVGRDKIFIGFAKEATRGTAVAASKWYPWMSLSFTPKNKKVYDNSAFGVLEEYSDAQIIQSWSEGKLDGRIADQSIGYLLYNLLGGYSSALHASETLVKDHTFTESQSNIPQSLTITHVDPNVDEQYPNGMVKEFDLDISQGKYVTFSADLVAAPGSTSTDTPAVSQENSFTSKHAIVKLASNVAGLTGASAAVIKSLKLKINRNVEPYFNIGNNAPVDIYAQKLNISGDITLRYVDTTYKLLDFNNTTNAMLIDLLNSDVTIGTSAHPELKLQFNALKFENWTADQQLDKTNEQTLSFTGMLDFSSGAGWQAVLTNLLTTY